jgi:hypothetical protein
VAENSESENYLRFLGALYLLTEGEVGVSVEIHQVCERADIPATENEDGGYAISTHLSKQGLVDERGQLLRSMVSLTPEGKALVERYLSE